jgi:hypothetical protein
MLGARREAPRRRRGVSPRVLFALLPLFRYSIERDAWILRVIGERFGPVLRAPTPAAPAPSKRHRRHDGRRRAIHARPSRLVLAVGCTIIVAALGFVIARVTSNPASSAALDRHATAGLLNVSFPSGWRRTSPPARPQLGLTDELAVAPAGASQGMLVIGRTTVTGNANLLPESLLATLPVAPKPQTVTVGKRNVYRYPNLHSGRTDEPESVYAVPTTVGNVVGVCLPQRAPASFASTCQQIFASLRLASGTLLPLGPSPSYASALNAVISRLNAVDARLGAQLRNAPDAEGQAKAADELGQAHAAAAAELVRVSAGPANGANTALVTALTLTAGAYRALGRAAAREDARGYGAATASLARATSALDSALAQLRTQGYEVI